MISAPARTQAALIFSEDFEDPADEVWGGGPDSFGSASGINNFSNSPHLGVTNGGNRYGTLVDVLGASPVAGPLRTAPILFSSTLQSGIALGGATINFEGWLASEQFDATTTWFAVDLYANPMATGPSLERILLADGSNSIGVVDSVDPSGSLGASWNADNWSLYRSKFALNENTQSMVLIYGGQGGALTDRAFADNIQLSITAVPEPSSLAFGLIMLSAIAISRRHRSRAKFDYPA